MMLEKCVLVSLWSRVWRRTVPAVPFAVSMAAAFLLAGRPAQAQTTNIMVTNLNGSGPGSLQAAITQSASTPPGQSTMINFTSGLSGTMLLSGTLSICDGQTLTIQGPAASQIAVSGQNQIPVFNVCRGTTVTISNLTIENGLGNSAGELAVELYAGGGGVQNLGTLTVTNSTFLDNSAGSSLSANGVVTPAAGGGILNVGALTLINSTFSGNSAVVGGGVANSGTLMAVTNSTFSGNSASGNGGGISDFSNFGFSDVRIKSTLLAGNKGGNCSTAGNLIQGDQGYNLSDDSSCGFNKNGDISSTAAGLDPNGLQNNGGATETIALLASSPAVDAIPLADCTDTNGNPVTTDQRGVSRPQGNGCDIGAYELTQSVAFASFQADLLILTGKPYGYALTALFTPGAGRTGITPATETVKLQIGSYSVTIPAGSFKPLGHGSNPPYLYNGTINGANTGVLITPLGGNRYGIGAAGASVNLSSATNPITVTLTIGDNAGTANVKAIRLQ